MRHHVTHLFLESSDPSSRHRRRIDDHLAVCSACREFYAAMRAALEPARSNAWPTLTPDPYRPARAEAVERRERSYVVAYRRNIVSAAVSGAALVCAVVVGILLGRAVSDRPDILRERDLLALYRSALTAPELDDPAEAMLNLSGEALP